MPVRGPGALEMPGAGTSGMEWVLTLLYDVYVCYILKVVLNVCMAWYVALVAQAMTRRNPIQRVRGGLGMKWIVDSGILAQ